MKRLWVGIGVVVLIAAAAVFLLTGDESAAPSGTPADGSGAVPVVAGPGRCPANGGRDQIVVFFGSADADADASKAMESLRQDGRIAAMAIEDRQHAFERFKETFKDQPGLVSLARIEAIPANLWIVPAATITNDQLAGQLRTELLAADEVRASVCGTSPPPTT